MSQQLNQKIYKAEKDLKHENEKLQKRPIAPEFKAYQTLKENKKSVHEKELERRVHSAKVTLNKIDTVLFPKNDLHIGITSDDLQIPSMTGQMKDLEDLEHLMKDLKKMEQKDKESGLEHLLESMKHKDTVIQKANAFVSGGGLAPY